MADPKAAGVIRATVKLATLRPRTMDAFTDYRETVAKRAVFLLANKNISEGNVRIAVQVLLGTITDAILLKAPGLMSAGSGRMNSALSNIFRGYLGITKSTKWAGTEAQDDEEPLDNRFFDAPPQGEDTVFDPELRVYRRPQAQQQKKKRSEPPSPAPSKVIPKMVAKPKGEKSVPVRRRHRFI